MTTTYSSPAASPPSEMPDPAPVCPFTEEECNAAFDAWKFNCGPGALCGALNKKPEEIRPHLLGFEGKGYTNPTLMFAILRGLNIRHQLVYQNDVPTSLFPLPPLALIRVQWEGPWTAEGVPMPARYRHTHWAALKESSQGYLAFDVNAVGVGGWIPYEVWRFKLLPWLIEGLPKATGKWWPTHIIQLALS